jgi:hypothetical protein
MPPLCGWRNRRWPRCVVAGEMMQFVASSFGELGVQGQYLDGELHLVDDALSAEMPARPQFQIPQFVVEFIAVFVVYAFFAKQWATNVFRHYVAMFVNLSTSAFCQLSVSRGMHVSLGGYWTPFSSFVPAFAATEFLAFVVARVTTIQGLHQATLFGFAAQLALKGRNGFLAHKEQLSDSFAVVNGDFGVRSSRIITYTGG